MRDIRFVEGDFGIRPYRNDDVVGLFEAARESIDEVYPWLEWCHPDYSIDDSASWVLSRAAAWREGREYAFVIFEAATGAFVGGIGLYQFNWVHLIGSLGYWVRTGYTGKGAATTAARLAARYGFEELELQRIEIVVQADNAASIRVAEKVGATREGVLRNRLIAHAKPCDAAMFSLVPPDMDTWPGMDR